MKKIAILLLLLVVFLGYTIPWSAGIGIIALLGFVFFSTTDWKTHPKMFIATLTTLSLLVILYALAPLVAPKPWSVCFQRSIVIETLKMPCEPSAQFSNGEKTFTADNISWVANTIPTYFMNDKLAFNWYLPTDPNREHLPYAMTLRRTVQGGSHQQAHIISSFSGLTAIVNGIPTTIPANQAITLYFPEDTSYELLITGSHTRNSSDVLSISGMRNSFSYTLFHIAQDISYIALLLLIIICAHLQAKLLSRNQRTMIIGIIILLVTLLVIPSERIGVVAVACFLLWFRKKENMFLIMTLFSILVLMSFVRPLIPYDHVFIDYGIPFLTILSVICWTFLKQRNITAWVITLLLLNSFVFISHTHPYGSLVLFTGGNDELTHEGFARIVLTGQTWRDKLIAGENYPFYYQPLYRYILASIHAIWGESMFGVYVLQTFLTSLAFFITLRFLQLLTIRYLLGIFTLLFLAPSFVYYVSLFTLSQSAFQQGIALPLLIICWVTTLRMLYIPFSLRAIITLFITWGIVYAIRTDFLPCLPLVIGIAGYSIGKYHRNIPQRFTMIAGGILGLSIGPALVVVRNFIIAHQAVFMPTSGLINLTSEFTPLFPNATPQDLQTLGYGDLLRHVYATYHNHLHLFYVAILHNLREKFIGIIPPRILLWYISPIITVCAFLLKPRRHIIVVLLFIALFFSILIPNIFFDQHNGVAMFGLYDYLLLILCAIAGSKLLYILHI